MRPSAPSAFRNALFSTGVALLSCQTVERLKRACAGGNVASCEKACEKGVFGEGGCFQAGQGRQREAALDFDGPAYERATALFQKACEGGVGDGCLFAAQMLEAPHAAFALDRGKDVSKSTIDDSDLSRRQELLVLACDRGSTDGCRRLGDVTIGKNSELAQKGYLTACARGPGAEACRAARGKEIEAFEVYRAGCKRQVADDCTALGNLVFRIDVPRAVRLFVAEAELRGVAPAAGGIDAFVALRVKEARNAAVIDPTKKRAATQPPPELENRIRTSVDVQGRIPRTMVERTIQREMSVPIASCIALDESNTSGGGELETESTVDLTGDVWRVTVLKSDLPEAVTRCLETVFSQASFKTPLTAIATVRTVLTVQPAEARPAARRITPPEDRGRR